MGSGALHNPECCKATLEAPLESSSPGAGHAISRRFRATATHCHQTATSLVTSTLHKPLTVTAVAWRILGVR